MNDTDRLRSLLQGLEIENIDELMTNDPISFLRLGELMSNRVKTLVSCVRDYATPDNWTYSKDGCRNTLKLRADGFLEAQKVLSQKIKQ